jgi:dTDP-glucose 4,6-dehydratase
MIGGIVLAMESDFHQPINLGNPDQVSVIQLAREILTLIPRSRSKIVFMPSPDYDPRDRRPDITRAKQILGWSPKVPRKKGLATLIEYFQSGGVETG